MPGLSVPLLLGEEHLPGALPEPSLCSALPEGAGKGLWALCSREPWARGGCADQPLKQAGTGLAAPEGVRSCLQPRPFWWQFSSSWPWVLKVCFCALILRVSPRVLPALCLGASWGSSSEEQGAAFWANLILQVSPYSDVPVPFLQAVNDFFYSGTK